MYLLIGLAIVAASVFTGYTLAHGEWGVLFQPAEFIIILGCGLGAFFGSQTKYTFSLIVKSLKHLFADPGSSKSRYLETLALLYALFSKMHREGVISIESDVEKPEASPIFSKYPNVSKDTRIVNFIGDTLRVSLTAAPEEEMTVAWELLRALGLRQRGPEIISCPTCGRTEIDLIGLAQEVERRLRTEKAPIKVAVMGCVVNGPGEAREADLGMAGGRDKGIIFRKGEVIRSVRGQEALLAAFMEELDKLLVERRDL